MNPALPSTKSFMIFLQGKIPFLFLWIQQAFPKFISIFSNYHQESIPAWSQLVLKRETKLVGNRCSRQSDISLCLHTSTPACARQVLDTQHRGEINSRLRTYPNIHAVPQIAPRNTSFAPLQDLQVNYRGRERAPRPKPTISVDWTAERRLYCSDKRAGSVGGGGESWSWYSRTTCHRSVIVVRWCRKFIRTSSSRRVARLNSPDFLVSFFPVLFLRQRNFLPHLPCARELSYSDKQHV